MSFHCRSSNDDSRRDRHRNSSRHHDEHHDRSGSRKHESSSIKHHGIGSSKLSELNIYVIDKDSHSSHSKRHSDDNDRRQSHNSDDRRQQHNNDDDPYRSTVAAMQNINIAEEAYDDSQVYSLAE